MRSSIEIHEIIPEQVTVDFSASPSHLAKTDAIQGEAFAYQKTLELLGLEARANPDHAKWSGLVIEGTTETVKRNIPNLKKHIGLIARYGAVQAGAVHRDELGRVLGRLTQETLPSLRDDARLLRTVGAITYPFADKTNDDGVVVYYQPKDEFPENPFSTVDIGGMHVDRFGQRATKHFDARSLLDVQDFHKFVSISQDQSVTRGERFDEVIRWFLDKAERSEVEHVEQPKMRNKTADAAGSRRRFVGVLHNLSRETMERLWDEFNGQKDINIGDILRSAIKDYVAENVQPQIGVN